MRRSVLLTVSLVAALTVSPVAQTSTWRPVILSDTGMVVVGPRARIRGWHSHSEIRRQRG